MLARIPMECAKTRDITGGLPRVAELFKARHPKDAAIIAEIEGTIRSARITRTSAACIIEPHERREPVEYLVPKGKPIHLQEGDRVEKGDYIVEGNPAPHDILAIKGVEALAAYLVNEIQEVYRLQGVPINDKHIEVIVRQMLQKVEIADAAIDLLSGEQVDGSNSKENEKLKAEGKKRRRQPVLLGITKAPADAFLHLGGLLPGNDTRADRSGCRRQGRQARGPEGKRHRRPPDPGGHRRGDDADPELATPRDELILDERRKGDRRGSCNADARRHGGQGRCRGRIGPKGEGGSAVSPDANQKAARSDPGGFVRIAAPGRSRAQSNKCVQLKLDDRDFAAERALVGGGVGLLVGRVGEGADLVEVGLEEAFLGRARSAPRARRCRRRARAA